MKLRKVTQSKEADYPSFEDYHANRRAFMKTVAFGIGGIVLASAGSGPAYAGDKVRPGGIPPAPAPRPPVGLKGDVAIVEPPRHEPKETELLGRIPAPRPPVKKPPVIKGALSPAQLPPKLAGQVPVPRPPPPVPGKVKPSVPPELSPKIRGEVRAPSPPKKDSKSKTE